MYYTLFKTKYGVNIVNNMVNDHIIYRRIRRLERIKVNYYSIQFLQMLHVIYNI
jgi:hypothetical protein